MATLKANSSQGTVLSRPTSFQVTDRNSTVIGGKIGFPSCTYRRGRKSPQKKHTLMVSVAWMSDSTVSKSVVNPVTPPSWVKW